MAKFQKGQSGNPGGRPAVVKNIQELARAKTPAAMAALVAALSNPGERVHAATALLAYAYGRPPQTQTLRFIRNWSDLSDEEVAALAGETPVVEDGTRH
jgi:hypothetical protein